MLLTGASVTSAEAAPAPATSFQLNPARTAAVEDGALRPPLRRLWTRRIWPRNGLGTGISYPIVAGGRVFVTAGRYVWALSKRNGRRIWRRPIRGDRPNLASLGYGSRRLFLSQGDCTIRALSVRSGRTLWRRRVADTVGCPFPVAAGGLVYVNGSSRGSRVSALSARSGRIRWQAVPPDPADSPVTLSRSSVFVSSTVPDVYAFSRRSGRRLWSFDTGGFGGGGNVSAAYRGRLFTIDSSDNVDSPVLDLRSGRRVGAWGGQRSFASIARGRAFYYTRASTESDNTLVSVAPGGVRPRWRVKADDLVTNPITTGRYVWVASETGRLYAVAARSGRRAWSTRLGDELPFEGQSGPPAQGVAAGDGVLVAPTLKTVVAYGPRRRR